MHKMGKIGLLVLTDPLKISRLIPAISDHVHGTLYVQYLPLENCTTLTHPRSVSIPKIAHYSVVTNDIYRRIALDDVDVRVLLHSLKSPKEGSIKTKNPIEVLIFDQPYSNNEINDFVKECASNLTADCSIVTNELDQTHPLYIPKLEPASEDCKMYDNVVLGGTFDRLHNGHKILLSEAVLRCKKRLTVGVTDISMIKSKVLWELIEPCSQRISSVRDFLQDVDPSLQYDVVPIDDPYGPTKEDATLEMIVVSTETYRGGLKVNEKRNAANLPLLDIHTVQLLETGGSTLSEAEEKKLSSSNRRLRLLGTLLRTPQPRPDLPPLPYVIGLTGGIASGKSSLAAHLKELGAGVVECDSLAHGLYSKGRDLHRALVDTFGKDILGPDGEIDRRALGALVFGNTALLEQLNSLVWPALLLVALEELQRLWMAGHRVVVLDAAVLLQAGWDVHCHEVWGCIVPPHEAVRRLQERNSLSEEEALRRIAAQPSNMEVVSRSHVVFSPAWSVDFTRRQVRRAWTRLLEEQPSLA